ncbi:hypothetical protein PHJA_000340500 [Phtheirospermum japonicum]|uniref:Uncharacterized protein n=1 Tax=Phtheirospermum japonicum TaxID=374723 RepID=A0A830B809_9LAMI|nr:hypothetical protein PHJA_000340500 [Phtheirospermum japonicum]
MMLGNEHCTWDHEANKVQETDWLVRFWNDVVGDAEFTAAYLKHGKPLFGLMDLSSALNSHIRSPPARSPIRSNLVLSSCA